MFYAGSGAEYGKQKDVVSVNEEDVGRVIPIDDYGIMKYSIAQAIEGSKNIYNLRLFGIFGKYENYITKFISNICCKTIKDIQLSIRQNMYFDYLWINDFCRMLEVLMDNELKYHTYNIVSGKKISLIKLCDIVQDISKKKMQVFVCKEGLANEYTASNNRFISEFQLFKYTPIDEAVCELYNWYKDNVEIDIYSLLY